MTPCPSLAACLSQERHSHVHSSSVHDFMNASNGCRGPSRQWPTLWLRGARRFHSRSISNTASLGPVIFRHDAFLTPARRRRHPQFRGGQDLFADPDKIGLRGPAVVPFSRGHGTFTEVPPPYLTKFQLGRVSIPSIEMSRWRPARTSSR